MKIFVLVTFILMYALIIILPKRKAWIAGASVLVMGAVVLIGGVIKAGEVFAFIDFNVLLMLLGIMITVGFFADSGMPARLADRMISKIHGAVAALTLLVVMSGLVSAFVDNVATVLMLAPIGLAVAKKIDVSPIPVLIGIAVSSNLQGAATLVGDTTSIMLGGFADMSFFDFFFLDGKFSIFWVVEIGALATIPVILFIFRKDRKTLQYKSDEVKVKSIVPTVLLLLSIAGLVVTSFIPDKPSVTNGIICLAFGIVGIIHYIVKNRAGLKSPNGGTEEGNQNNESNLNVKDGENKKRGKSGIVGLLKKAVDYETILFLLFLFVIIGIVEEVGIISDISALFGSIGNKNVFLLYTVIVFGSVLCSAFIDNIPYVATMLPVIEGLAASMPQVSPYLLYFGLLIGATLGGNLTPVGASANVVATGILNKEGYKVKSSDFFKIGIPFTLTAVLVGYALVWFIWGM